MSDSSHGAGHETQDFTFNRVIWMIPVAMLLLLIFVFIVWSAATASLTHEMRAKQTEGADSLAEVYHAFRAQEDSMLDNYAWKDKANGIVQIPIQRAMEIMAQRAAQAHDSTPEVRRKE